MSTAPLSAGARAPIRALGAALVGGLVAGTLDIFLASLIYGAPVPVILKAMASGLLGKAAFQGGLDTAMLGLGLQGFISVVAALVYVLAARALPILLRRPLVFGPMFGAGVFIVMHAVVLPLSQASAKLPPQPQFAEDFAANMLFGLIIAQTANWALRRRGGD